VLISKTLFPQVPYLGSMGTKLSLNVVYGDVKFAVNDPAIDAYLASNKGREEPALRAALLCGVEAIDSAGASRHALALEQHFQAVSAQIAAFAQSGIKETQGAVLRAATSTDRESLLSQVSAKLNEQAAAILANLDPENPDSAYGRFAVEMRATVRELGQFAAKEEARKELAPRIVGKGRTYEDDVVAALAACLSGTSDTVESTGDEVGLGSSKKGDAIIRCAGPRPATIVVEAKRRKISLSNRFIDEELRGGIDNRGGSAAILAVHPEHGACLGAPIKFLADNIIACVYDPEQPATALEVAYQVMRAWALREKAVGHVLDTAKVQKRLAELASKIDSLVVLERAMDRSIGDLDASKAAIGNIRRSLMRDCQDMTRDLAGDVSSVVPQNAAAQIPDGDVAAAVSEDDIAPPAF